MSIMIQQILEVVASVQDNSPSDWKHDRISQLRLDASREVARRWKVNPTTITDACTRRLGDDFGGVKKFDSLVERWLRYEDLSLKRVLTEHAPDWDDVPTIAKFFSGHQKAGHIADKERQGTI